MILRHFSFSAYYKAYVKDVFPESTEVLLRFERDWQPESRFPVARVRLPPPAPASGSASDAFKEGDEIEVFSRASDQVNIQICNTIQTHMFATNFPHQPKSLNKNER